MKLSTVMHYMKGRQGEYEKKERKDMAIKYMFNGFLISLKSAIGIQLHFVNLAETILLLFFR